MSIVAPLLSLYVIAPFSPSPYKLLGLSSTCQTSVAVLWPLTSTLFLYSGVILNSILDRIHDYQGSFTQFLGTMVQDLYVSLSGMDKLILFRNLLWGPLTEEWVFRSCIISILLSINVPYSLSLSFIVWITLGIFGIVHIHHYIEYVRSGIPPKLALLNVTVMFLYTSLFGALLSYFYLSTFSILSIILPHTFCNYMGLPSFSFLHDKRSSLLIRCSKGLFVLLGIGLFFYTTGIWSKDQAMFSPCTRWNTPS